MAGHKHLSSTERYQLSNLDNLQEKIEKLHPLNHNQNGYKSLFLYYTNTKEHERS